MTDSSIRVDRIVERRLETMTQACVDIGRILLVDFDRTVPESNPATMYALNELGVLSDETATAMAEACSFRNVLAHRYGQVIDDELVFEAVGDLTNTGTSSSTSATSSTSKGRCNRSRRQFRRRPVATAGR